MKKFTLLLYTFVVLLSLRISAQDIVLDSIFLSDSHIHRISKTRNVNRFSETDLQNNATNISDLLRFQSPIFIKENGRGMVSSPSFRGTTAAQTAILWNGIPINSMFLGQGDLNNIPFLDAQKIDIISGGGSVIHGSGAIGGSIHLQNNVLFNKGFLGSFFTEVGDFSTINSMMKTHFSQSQFSFDFTAGIQKSQNNYEVPELRNYQNINGQYENISISMSAAYRPNNKNYFTINSQTTDGVQHFPIWETSMNSTQYLTDNFRSLLGWKYTQQKWQNQLKLALLEERFRYFPNIKLPFHTETIGKTSLFKNDFLWKLIPNINFHFLTEAKNESVESKNSGLQNPSRNSGNLAILVQYNSTKKWYFEAGIRKEWVENVNTPLLFSFAAQHFLKPWYEVSFHFSKNFRIPTFNDLFWIPGGKLHLRSEQSYQAEMGNRMKWKNINIMVSPYFIRIKDMIRWIPNKQGIWEATNTQNVASYGVETQLNYSQKWNEKININCKMGYAYTKSTDLDTKKQLAFVPFHKIFGSVELVYQSFRILGQCSFNGTTFTTSDQNTQDAFKPYSVFNLSLFYSILNKYEIFLRINNISNTIYETSPFYPMPKRNFSMGVKFTL